MADVSAPEILEGLDVLLEQAWAFRLTYTDVRSDKSETNWLIINYESDRSDKLKLTATGTGGLDEIKDKFPDNDAAYAYIRVHYSNDKESTRSKFCLITWIGPSTKIMRKAKVSVQAGDVKQVIRTFSIDVAARDAGDLDEEAIVKRLRKAGGASYDGV